MHLAAAPHCCIKCPREIPQKEKDLSDSCFQKLSPWLLASSLWSLKIKKGTVYLTVTRTGVGQMDR